MDPNSGKKNMFNKLSRQDCLNILESERFRRKTVSFYKYTHFTKLPFFRDELYKEWNELNILGRIYIASEGINAQISVPEHNWIKFKKKMESRPEFADMPFKIAIEDDGKSFLKLTIKIREKIVGDGLPQGSYDVTNVGKHLSAKECNQEMDNGAIVVDMRNHYESEIGKFQGAICPDVETFRDELPFVKNLLQGKEEEKILLYCTGGIRCEKASSFLKHNGFKDVNQLYGGIIDYVRQLDKDRNLENKFSGRNFVFDERRGERISEDIISACHQCSNLCDIHVNCKNVNCNLLFLQCDSCKEKYYNCCSIDCINVVNLTSEEQKQLRKGKENKKMYYSHKRVNLKLKK